MEMEPAEMKTSPAIAATPSAESWHNKSVLELEAGDLVAADARLLTAASFKCVECALTGESEAVEKHAVTLGKEDVPLGDRENMIFMGTSVVAGSGRAVVVATAMQTEMGNIAGLLEEAGADEDTPLQQKLTSFGRILVWASLGIVALLFVLGLLRGMPFLELFMTAVSLTVAGGSRRSADGRHHCAGDGSHAHVTPPCAGAQAACGRNAGIDECYLHRQDRHAHRRRNDRARALRRRTNL